MKAGRRSAEAVALLSALGLPPDAGVPAVRDARDRLAAFLADPPEGLAAWASGQLALADRALALVTPAARAASDDDGTYVDVAAVEAGPVSGERSLPAPALPPAPLAPTALAGLPHGPAARRRPALLPLAILALAGGLVWSVYYLGGSSAAQPADHPAATASAPASASATLDADLVARLEASVAADPSDAASLRALAEEYFRVARYAESATWQERLVALDPADADNQLILGVAYFNDGNLDAAEATWRRAADLAPTSPDPWYNLGFVHLGTNPPDHAAARAAWQRVIELAPGSELAATVESHLDQLAAEPTPSPTPTE